jgi:hypothetical protein
MRRPSGHQRSTRRPRLVVFIAAVLVALVVAACDPSYSHWIQNDSARAIIVKFDGQAVVVPAGGRGLGTSSIGVYEGQISVADLSCRTTIQLDATTQKGIVVIDGSGARLDDIARSPAAVIDALSNATFEETQRCVGHVQPGASFDPLSDRSIVFIGGQARHLFRIGSGSGGLTQLTDGNDLA